MATYNTVRVGTERLPGKGRPPLAVSEIPVVAGLVYAGLMGQGLRLGSKNYAVPEANGRMTGQPLDAAGFINFVDGAGLDTGVAEMAACTYLVIGKKPNTTAAAALIGSYIGGNNTGVGIFASADVMSAVVEKTSGQTNMTVAGDVTRFALYSLSVPATGAAKFVNHTSGSSSTSGNTEARRVTSTDNVLVGGFDNPAFQREAHVALAFVYNRALTDAEMTLTVAWAKAYAATVGISV